MSHFVVCFWPLSVASPDPRSWAQYSSSLFLVFSNVTLSGDSFSVCQLAWMRTHADLQRQASEFLHLQSAEEMQ